MQTAFCIGAAIVLAVTFMALHGNNLTTQVPGQRSATLPGKTSAPAESAGLSASPGLSQREFK